MKLNKLNRRGREGRVSVELRQVQQYVDSHLQLNWRALLSSKCEGQFIFLLALCANTVLYNAQSVQSALSAVPNSSCTCQA